MRVFVGRYLEEFPTATLFGMRSAGMRLVRSVILLRNHLPPHIKSKTAILSRYLERFALRFPMKIASRFPDKIVKPNLFPTLSVLLGRNVLQPPNLLAILFL